MNKPDRLRVTATSSYEAPSGNPENFYYNLQSTWNDTWIDDWSEELIGQQDIHEKDGIVFGERLISDAGSVCHELACIRTPQPVPQT